VYVLQYLNKRILITANKRIHIISAYFLAAASDKRMRLLTSLYGINIGVGMGSIIVSYSMLVTFAQYIVRQYVLLNIAVPVVFLPRGERVHAVCIGIIQCHTQR